LLMWTSNGVFMVYKQISDIAVDSQIM